MISVHPDAASIGNVSEADREAVAVKAAALDLEKIGAAIAGQETGD